MDRTFLMGIKLLIPYMVTAESTYVHNIMMLVPNNGRPLLGLVLKSK